MKTTGSRREFIFSAWCVLALGAAAAAAVLLDGSFPFFTVVWILVPLAAVIRSRDAGRVGFRAVPLRELAAVAAINLAVIAGLMLVFEPWSHTYQRLVEGAVGQSRPDTTFAWLVRYPRLPALAGMLAYSGSVTMFGEELFFRGWLLQLLRRRWNAAWAVILQALLFAAINSIAVIVLSPLQGFLYVAVYAWLGVGLVGGWAAARTGSIWPSLVSAALSNLVLVILLT